VIDLMEALRRSVEEAKGKSKGAAAKKAAARPPAKKQRAAARK
jgi:non-homologous end joining protein Ku